MTTTAPPTVRPERVTRTFARDVLLPHGRVLALLTLDNGLDHTAPNTLGPRGLAELTAALRAVERRAGDLAAVALIGKPYSFAAGADLTQVASVATREQALALGTAGHAAYTILSDLPMPTFAFINGVALGGGFEAALACDYRAASSDVRAIGLPETGLGLVPGWGGSYRVPRLVGIEQALEVILARPAAGRPYTARQALAAGLVDEVFDPADFLEASVRWIVRVLDGQAKIARPALDPPETWAAAIDGARGLLTATVHGSRPAPWRALELLAARDATREEAFAAEDRALGDLVLSDELRASVYAFALTSGARKPRGRRRAEAEPGSREPAAQTDARTPAARVQRVGIVGAGLMAAQIAQILARRLAVPVVMRDLDEERVAAGLEHVRTATAAQAERGRLSSDAAARLIGSVTGTTRLEDLAQADLVVEAVTESLDLKRRVFGELERVLAPDAVIATNTSALSVTAMAEGLAHPERVIGLHFFNPVAAMPLVEVIRAQRTSPDALDLGVGVAAALGKTAIETADRPGFVVNRLLVLLLARVLAAVEAGLDVAQADRALDPLGLPMRPFELLDLVGPAVGLHVLTSLREGLGDRFARSPGLERLVADGTRLVLDAPAGLPRPVNPVVASAFGDRSGAAGTPTNGLGGPGPTRPDVPALLDDVLASLTREVGLMLDEGVVAGPSDIDLAMILGAGWGFHLGGICPYLDRTGYSVRILGRRLLPDGVANVPGR